MISVAVISVAVLSVAAIFVGREYNESIVLWPHAADPLPM